MTDMSKYSAHWHQQQTIDRQEASLVLLRAQLITVQRELELYKPICLNCDRDRPCMTDEEAAKFETGIPCTFEPTPKMLFERVRKLQLEDNMNDLKLPWTQDDMLNEEGVFQIRDVDNALVARVECGTTFYEDVMKASAQADVIVRAVNNTYEKIQVEKRINDTSMTEAAKKIEELRESQKQLFDYIDRMRENVEMVAANMAYNCGLGVSEWEAFIDRTPQYVLWKEAVELLKERKK